MFFSYTKAEQIGAKRRERDDKWQQFARNMCEEVKRAISEKSINKARAKNRK